MARSDDSALFLADKQLVDGRGPRALVEVNSFTGQPRGRAQGRRAPAASSSRSRGSPAAAVPSEQLRGSLGLRVGGEAQRRGAGRRSSGTSTPCSRRASSRASARDGDLARGPGVLDMKGGLVVVAWALQRARRDRRARRGCPAARRRSSPTKRSGSPEGQGAHPQRDRRRAARALVFEAGRDERRDHHRAAKAPARMTVDRARQGGARGQRAQGGRERASGRSRASSTARSSSPTTRAA